MLSEQKDVPSKRGRNGKTQTNEPVEQGNGR